MNKNQGLVAPHDRPGHDAWCSAARTCARSRARQQAASERAKSRAARVSKRPPEASRLKPHASQRGFSLIELIVVLVILGLLATVVGPKVMERLGKGKAEIAKLQIDQLEGALGLFRFDVGRYPTSSEGLQALIENNAGIPNWSGPYLDKKTLPKDPWRRDYQYRSPGQHSDYDLWSVGADGVEGGEGDNADVTSW